ncbi:MAG: hypothetical protein IJ272_03985 [Clostridia bacterium]|nr:hypothetical protein [Clostridia bacterium]
MDKKRIVVIISVVLLVIAIIATVVLIPRNDDEQVGDDNDVINHSVKVTGKLQEYIINLTDNYYIKYSGKFKNNSGELVNAIIEYTKDGDNFAFRSSEINMYLIGERQTLYSISHSYKMILTMPKTSLDTSEYNLASDIGQTFVKSYKENIGSTEYDVEEYLYNGNQLKYYFKENDIKLIRYNSEDIRTIRLEKQTNKELLVKPSGYANANLIDNVNIVKEGDN